MERSRTTTSGSGSPSRRYCGVSSSSRIQLLLHLLLLSPPPWRRRLPSRGGVQPGSTGPVYDFGLREERGAVSERGKRKEGEKKGRRRQRRYSSFFFSSCPILHASIRRTLDAPPSVGRRAQLSAAPMARDYDGRKEKKLGEKREGARKGNRSWSSSQLELRVVAERKRESEDRRKK